MVIKFEKEAKMIGRSEDIWDKKATKFPKFDEDPNSTHFVRTRYFEMKGANFEGSKVLDIGCGTGRYALVFAQNAKEVHALDVSSGMLKVLEDEAEKRGYCNITTIKSGFDSFDVPKDFFDITFTSMTPAIQSEAEVKKVLDITKNHWAYIGWGRKRKNELAEAVFADHKVEYVIPNGAIRVQKLLNSMGIDVEIEFEDDSWTNEKTIEEAYEDIAWHLEISGGVPDRGLITKRLEKSADSNGLIKETTEVEVGMFLLDIAKIKS